MMHVDAPSSMIHQWIIMVLIVIGIGNMTNGIIEAYV